MLYPLYHKDSNFHDNDRCNTKQPEVTGAAIYKSLWNGLFSL